MDELQKLRHLIEHWEDHNAGHAETYLEWSRKADAMGKKDLAAILIELSERTRQLKELFNKARDLS